VTLQPLLHDLVATVSAPTSALAPADGQIRGTGVQGGFHADARVLSQALLRLDGREPESIGHAVEGADRTRFVLVARWLGDRIGDPDVRIDRIRRVAAGRIEEVIEIASSASVPVTTTVTVDLAVDLAAMETVRSGGEAQPVAPALTGGVLTWQRDGLTVTATAPGATVAGGRFGWQVELPARERVVLSWALAVDDPKAVVRPSVRAQDWSRPEVRADDHRLTRLVDRSLDDLHALRLGDGDDTYLAAGVPWYLTLFGRDSLWAARMLLPLGTDLAAGTLRVLARRQGTKVDPASAEAPGKIMHELRRHELILHDGGLRLPAVYYGTIDATLLWISLLHDAWRWGLADDQVAGLLPSLAAALGWLDGYADPDGDGFVEYLDSTGHGLANQGWKDSGDAVRFRDGRLAEPPIALVEVQGYAYRAALDGAALLDAFGRPGGEKWRDYAAGLADRFRAKFWVDGGYPALALDRDKRPVDSLTSNIGHLLDTGILNVDEEQAVAAALASEPMSGAYGLRTMSADSGGYSPLSYHCGSVWAHDTAIATAGLARAGFADAASTLIDGLLTAGEAFDYRLPELHSGDARAELSRLGLPSGPSPRSARSPRLSRPMPYPAACKPQAWAAAAAISLLQATLGIYPDVPNGVVALRPLGAVSARGLRIAGSAVDVHAAADGTATISGLPAGLSVEQGVDADGQARVVDD
jgi:glycogen debranching enzyme